MKIAVLTSKFGQGLHLRDPKIKFENVDYFAYVDKINPNCKIWNQIECPDFSSDDRFRDRRNAKIYKVMPHLFLPNYDFWFWVDLTHEVIMNPFEVIERFIGNAEIGLWKHTTRKCAYQEAEVVNIYDFDHRTLVDNQVEYYKSCGFPENNGLYELPVSIRKNTDKVKKLNLRWWEQICRFSSRDQISMTFVLWKTDLNPVILPGWANGGFNQNPIMPQVRNKGE